MSLDKVRVHTIYVAKIHKHFGWVVANLQLSLKKENNRLNVNHFICMINVSDYMLVSSIKTTKTTHNYVIYRSHNSLKLLTNIKRVNQSTNCCSNT